MLFISAFMFVKVSKGHAFTIEMISCIDDIFQSTISKRFIQKKGQNM